MCTAVLCAFGTQNAPQGMMPSLFGSPWAIPYGDVGAITFMGHLMRRQMHEHGLESLDYAHIADSLKTARAAIAGMVAHLPTHEEFLQSVQAG